MEIGITIFYFLFFIDTILSYVNIVENVEQIFMNICRFINLYNILCNWKQQKLKKLYNEIVLNLIYINMKMSQIFYVFKLLIKFAFTTSRFNTELSMLVLELPRCASSDYYYYIYQHSIDIMLPCII